jgi:hypothetical protein
MMSFWVDILSNYIELVVDLSKRSANVDVAFYMGRSHR